MMSERWKNTSRPGAGYLAHEDAKWWFGSGGMIDFTNHQAADWWNDLAPAV
jgi:alpha-glucosidase (family GH31 glycosyl hydrolase)